MPPLTPLDLQHKEFPRAMRGYAVPEVDAYLDQVAQELIRTQEAITRLQEPPADRANKEAIACALITAQQLVEQTAHDAKVKAQTTMIEAQAAAKRITDAAELRAREIIDAADLHARETNDQLAQRQQTLEKSIDALRAFERDYRGRLRACVEALLKALENGAPTGSVAPPMPPGA
jgi:DivIVA domain-containing protein